MSNSTILGVWFAKVATIPRWFIQDLPQKLHFISKLFTPNSTLSMKRLYTSLCALFLVISLQAQQITGFENTTIQVNIAELVGVPAGIATYSVNTNSNESVATVAITGDVATVDFLALGQTKLNVTYSTPVGGGNQDVYLATWPQIDVTNKAVVDFETPSLAEESYWNGSDGSGGFTNNEVFFPNTFADYGTYTTWSGWGYSNVTDNTTAGHGNQFGNITASGMDTLLQNNEDQFAIAFTGSNKSTVHLPQSATEKASVSGVYVTNSTYAALSMEEGDDFAKKFGGASGDDEDWFLLTATGYKDGIATSPEEFYLADFRFEDNSKDYIVITWQWFDLSGLGVVDSIDFSLSSSDVGQYGMNTPATFAVDNLVYNKEVVSSVFAGTTTTNSSVYPNPSAGTFYFNAENVKSVEVQNLQGATVYQTSGNIQQLDLTHLASGNYIFRVETENGFEVSKVMKQ